MRRLETFTLRINDDERKEIDELASRTHRTRADAIRFIIKAGLNALTKNDLDMFEVESTIPADDHGQICHSTK